LGSQAGLSSAITGTFIVAINSQLQPDPGEETAALLRVLIHRMDNTAFGEDAPPIPRWTGPPCAIVQVQCILYASLSASIFAAFLAMVGKQWLNQYSSTDVRGSAIERSQNRQRKLNGIVEWRFSNVMELLSLILQLALLLLACGLSFYLWSIEITVAVVPIAVTLSSTLFYLFTVVVGAAYENCPYQTPGARVLRLIQQGITRALPRIPAVLYPALDLFFSIHSVVERSEFIGSLKSIKRRWAHEPWWSRGNFRDLLKINFPSVACAFARDLALIARKAFRLPLVFARRARVWLSRDPSVTNKTSGRKAINLDFRCISWMLEASMDKSVNLIALEFLSSILELPGFDATIVVDCFNVLAGCISIGDHNQVAVTHGAERLAEIAAACVLSTFSHLSIMEPTSTVLEDARQRYGKVFPLGVDFHGLPFCFTMNATHRLFNGRNRHFAWEGSNPSVQEQISVAHALVKVAWSEHQRAEGRRKVPRWVLRFVHHSVSQSPPPPTSVIIDCLFIIAIGLGCDVSKSETTVWDKRFVLTHRIITPLTQNQCGAKGYHPFGIPRT